MTGQAISHYRILDKLGEGGMGVVYRAEDLKLKRIVALKFLAQSALADPVAKARMVREAQAAGCLDHPNICHVYDLEESGAQMFTVMACVEGKSLAQILDAGLSLSTALDIAIQVGEGRRRRFGQGRKVGRSRRILHSGVALDPEMANALRARVGWPARLRRGWRAKRNAAVGGSFCIAGRQRSHGRSRRVP